MQREQRPAAPAVKAENVPEELKALHRWVAWRYRRRQGQWAKVPVCPASGKAASTTDPATWGTFEQALGRYRKGKLDGVGFVFDAADPFSGIDLDDCRDPAGGALQPWAKAIVAEMNSYTEVSPSGTGVKVWVRGKVPAGGPTRKGGIEVYSQARYFTVTGERLGGTPAGVEGRQEQLLRLHARVFAEAAPERAAAAPADEDLIRRAMTAKNGEGFARLWNGDLSGKTSPSEADLALLNYLAYWTGGDRRRMESLFGMSALGRRDKWLDRPDYRERTLDKALAGWRQFSPQGRALTRGDKIDKNNQEHAGGDRSTQDNPGTLSTRHAYRREVRNAQEDTITQGLHMAIELAGELGHTPCWESSFILARRLRRLADDRPEQFEKAVGEFCTRTGQDFDELWYAYLACWDKVKVCEGEDVFAWAAQMAERQPLQFDPALRPLYNRVGSVAWHLAGLTYPRPFWLPRERLAPLLGVSAQTACNVIGLLVKNGVLACVDPDYSFTQGKAKEYAFTGTPLGEQRQGPAA